MATASSVLKPLGAPAFLGLLALTSPVQAACPPSAKLVRCGVDTCLRVSGHRPAADVAVLIAGRELAIEGGRNWRITVPVAAARRLATASGGTLNYQFAGPAGDVQAAGEVVLPPGALGRRVELAALIVRAH